MILYRFCNLSFTRLSTQPVIRQSKAFNNLVRFIDASGKSQGLVPKESIVIPPEHELIQVAPSVYKLKKKIEQSPNGKVLLNSVKKAEEKKKSIINKIIQIRPAIAANDLERKLQIIRHWLVKTPRVSSVTLLVKKESGLKSHLRGITADKLVNQICIKLEAENSIRSTVTKRDGMEISCTFTIASNKKEID